MEPPDRDYAVVVPLQEDWVKDNISEGFQKILKELHDPDKPRHVLIPEGDSSCQSDTVDGKNEDNQKMH